MSKFNLSLNPLGVKVVVLLIFLIVLGLISGCTLTASKEISLQQTQDALILQATINAQQATINAQNTQQVELAQGGGQPTVDVVGTQIAQAAAATMAAHQLTQTASAPTATLTLTPTPTQTTEAIPAPTNTTPPQTDMDFNQWLQSTSILLFEDMAGDFTTGRYIKQALDAMGLRYVDVKDALGLFKDQLLSGGPGGRGWDLAISGKELRTAISGEFYVYLNDLLNQGSSVIIEDWDLDSIWAGTVSTILSRCGVAFQSDWFDEPLNEQLLWPIEGTHPIHHQPNEGVSLRNPSGYWLGDLGDLLKLNPGSSATPLWGLNATTYDSSLTAVSCLDGRLIIQTYSTHSYGRDRILLMWQNYVYNTLKARFDLLQQSGQ
ncbi:MAG: hypothetical protein AB1345_13095 [Chloroflexota bacterium]